MSRYAINITEKRLGERVILRHAQVSLESGVITSIVGQSGCGKSTLLRLIAGLDRDFRGQVQRLTEPSALAGGSGQSPAPTIGMVFQEPRLLPWLDVAANVGFGLQHKDSEALVSRLLQEVGLAASAATLPKALSGGMAQRVSIARALVREPDILLLDEPFSALDVVTKSRLHGLVTALTKQHRTATLMVTHDPDEALDLSRRIYVLGQQPATVVDVIDCSEIVDAVTRASARARLLRSLGVTQAQPTSDSFHGCNDPQISTSASQGAVSV
jgi:sulfonate transport system ATP-binding protein